MKNTDLSYWFTKSGGEEYEEILEKYYKSLIERSSSYEVTETKGYSIVKMLNFPGENMCTFITKGLSCYILGNTDCGYLRQEIATTVELKYDESTIIEILDEIGQNLLDRRKPVEDELFDISSQLSNQFPKICGAAVFGGVWLDDSDQGFLGDINTSIQELILITKKERELIFNSPDEFIGLAESGSINILNPFR